MSCPYTFKRGQREGEECGRKLYKDYGYCSTHYRMVKQDNNASVKKRKKEDEPQDVEEIDDSEEIIPAIIPEIKEKPPKGYEIIRLPKFNPVKQTKPPKQEIVKVDGNSEDESEINDGELAEIPEPEEDETNEEEEDVREMLLSNDIRKLYNLYPNLKKEMPLESKNGYTNQMWKQMLLDHITNKNSENNMMIGSGVVLSVIEAFALIFGINILGSSEQLLMDPEYQTLAKLVMIKNSDYLPKLSPEWSLALKVGNTMAGRYKTNSVLEKQGLLTNDVPKQLESIENNVKSTIEQQVVQNITPVNDNPVNPINDNKDLTDFQKLIGCTSNDLKNIN